MGHCGSCKWRRWNITGYLGFLLNQALCAFTFHSSPQADEMAIIYHVQLQGQGVRRVWLPLHSLLGTQDLSRCVLQDIHCVDQANCTCKHSSTFWICQRFGWTCRYSVALLSLLWPQCVVCGLPVANSEELGRRHSLQCHVQTKYIHEDTYWYSNTSVLFQHVRVYPT